MMELRFDVDRLMMIQDEAEWKVAYEEEIQKFWGLMKKLGELEYEMYTKGTQSSELGELMGVIPGIANQLGFIDKLNYWKDHIDDPNWKRRLQLMVQTLSNEKINNDPELTSIIQELQGMYLQKTFEFNGETYDFGMINKSLMENPNREVRKNLRFITDAFAKEVSPKVRQLIKKRNEIAQREGYDNFYDFKFTTSGLDWEQYKKECLTIIEKTKEVSNRWETTFKKINGWDEICFYDLLYLILNSNDLNPKASIQENIIPTINDSILHWGYQPEDISVKFEMVSIPFGGFCLPISPKDIRVVLNPRENWSLYATAFHEFGHALYSYFASDEYFEMYQFIDIISTEAIAEVFCTISRQKEWFLQNFDISEEKAEEFIELQRWCALSIMKIYFYLSLVEHEIYEDPDVDVEKLAVEMYQLVFGKYEKIYHPFAEMVFITHPVYMQSYIYADGIKEMFKSKLGFEGMYGEKEIFERLREEYLKPGEMLTWQEKVKNICGEDFSFKYFVDYLTTFQKGKSPTSIGGGGRI